MAARLKGRILYGAAVKRVVQDATGVRVAFDRAGRRETLTSQRAVLAIPFSVLRGMEISPQFSIEKRRVIAELSHTSIVRVYLQYRSRPWGAATPLAWGATDLPIMSVREPTYNQTGGRGILEAVISGANARRVTAMTEEERINFTQSCMEKVFPEARGQYERGISKCWDSDPWALGGYAWFRPGEMKSLGPHIPRPEGRIHFAGDQTSDRPGWMQGAIASGHRAAREIDSLS